MFGYCYKIITLNIDFYFIKNYIGMLYIFQKNILIYVMFENDLYKTRTKVAHRIIRESMELKEWLPQRSTKVRP